MSEELLPTSNKQEKQQPLTTTGDLTVLLYRWRSVYILLLVVRGKINDAIHFDININFRRDLS